MLFSNLVHLKALLMVLTAGVGTVAGGTMIDSYANSRRPSPSFVLTASPSTLSLGQNTTMNSNITVTSLNRFSGTVSLSLFFIGPKVGASLSHTSVRVPSNGNAKSTLTVTAANALGNYTIVVIGLSSSHGRTNYASTTLTVQVVSNQDFTITSNPSNILNIMGSANLTTITLTSIKGYAGNVSLAVTAPFGYITVTGSQSPLMLSPGGMASSTLTIATSPNTQLGVYTITVTGTAGSRVHTTTIALTVVDPTLPPPVVESLTLNSHEFINGTSLLLTLQNTGNTSVTLTSYVVRDALGNAWSLTSWLGPTMLPNSFGTANIRIGSGCPGCIYSGIPGLFFQFTVGQQYTITVTTAKNNQFTFTVIR